MRYTSLALLAGASSVLAQGTTGVDINSVFSVLQTAIPSSLAAAIATDDGAAFSSISAQFAAGSTPSWYTALPSDVKSFIAGNGVRSALATLTDDGSALTVATSSGSVMVTARSTTSAGATTTRASTAATTGTTGTTSAGAAGATSSTTTRPTNAAVPMTVGAGLAGAAGLLGLLVL